MKYKDNIDYLVSAILYLGTHNFYWARTPDNLGAELSVDPARLGRVFEGFPGLFRRSRRRAANGQPFYALQARYAQREGGDTKDPEEVSYIAPLSVEKLKMLTDFVSQSAEAERVSGRAIAGNLVSAVAAVIAAATAVYVAVVKLDGGAGEACAAPRAALTSSSSRPATLGAP